MTSERQEVVYKSLSETLVATTRTTLKRRDEMPAILRKLKQTIPSNAIAGPPFCIFRFITSISDGFDVEVGFPVHYQVEAEDVKSRVLPAMEVLSVVHQGPPTTVRQAYREVYGYAAAHSIISDEFCQEVYLIWDTHGEQETEVQFVIHRWDALFSDSLTRVLGDATSQQVMEGADALTIASTAEERFQWTKSVLETLQGVANMGQQYEILSNCAHIFPSEQIAKLRVVYEEAKARTGDALAAVDAVLAFMEEDPGWGAVPTREGRRLISAKKPRDPEAYAKAETEAEKRSAYCFCPLIRDRLDAGMPGAFCYCGAGWFRQQWEGATGRPVRIEILKSILRGDDECQFAICLDADAL